MEAFETVTFGLSQVDDLNSGVARCYTDLMPTTRPRHTITETPTVHAALEKLREKLPGERIDFSELVILGAQVKAHRLPDHKEDARRAHQELAEWISQGTGPAIDIVAADEVKHLGQIVNFDD